MTPRSMRHLGCLVLVVAAACDPVHQNAVDALGGEAPGVRPGQFHRPGQPCTLCHDGSIGSPQAFSVAGTIFSLPSEASPAMNATVHLLDFDGKRFDATTNSAGNFYVTPQEFSPRYPMTVTVESAGASFAMNTLVETESACAGCHVDPAGPTSPGHVFASPYDGGAPP